MTFLIIDAGSSSVRALLYDEQAQPIRGAIARQPLTMQTEDNGAATFDVVALRQTVENCIDSVLQHPAAQRITAAGMATFAGNVVGLDAQTCPVTPLYTYADTQCSDDIAILKARLDTAAYHQRTGAFIHTAYQPARLNWLRRTQPDTFQKVALWCDFGTYCYQTWFGRPVPCSYSIASWSGMLNRHRLTWDELMLNAAGISAGALPELADYSTTQSGLTASYRQRWQRLADVPFYLAHGDGVPANIGSGGIDPQLPVLTIGTTAAVRIVTDKPATTIPDGLWAYRVDATRQLIGGATTEGGNVFQWATQTLQISPDEIEPYLKRAAPDSHGLTVLPLLGGERSPGWQSDATGIIEGLRFSTSPLEIVHAMLESVALRLGMILRQLNPPAEVVYAGGGALHQSAAWAQIVANALGRTLWLIDTSEVTANGTAALIYQHQHGQLPHQPAAVAHTYEADSTTHDMYLQASQRQQRLYRRFY